jgi:hypothetical protein
VLADDTTISWASVGGADRYDVIRGRVWDLPYQGFTVAECVASDIPATSATDPSTPAVGDGLYYLVRGEAGDPALCLAGTWGTAKRNHERAGCP